MNAAPRAKGGLVSRLFTAHAGTLLVRNTVVSCGTFAFDIALLWVLVEPLGMDKILAATLAFLAATTIHYALARVWIFRGTERAVAAGFVYFLINAGVGLVVTIALFAAFIEIAGMHYLIARVVASVFAGLTVFLLNAVLNFRSV